MDERAIIEAEFRGLFVGEGCIHLRKRWCGGARKIHTYCVHLSVAQRLDNDQILYWLQRNFGGTVHQLPKVGDRLKGRGSNPAAMWQVATRPVVDRLLRILLEGTLPSAKRAQAQAAIDFLGAMRPRGGRIFYTEEETALRESRYQAFKAMKRYDPTKSVRSAA